MTEKQIQGQILTYLNSLNDCIAFQINTRGAFNGKNWQRSSKFNPPGTPDIFCSYRGRALFLEVKTLEKGAKFWNSKGVHEIRQQRMIHNIIHKGAKCYMVSKLEQVRCALEVIDSIIDSGY